jgi:hypothetical protein
VTLGNSAAALPVDTQPRRARITAFAGGIGLGVAIGCIYDLVLSSEPNSTVGTTVLAVVSAVGLLIVAFALRAYFGRR